MGLILLAGFFLYFMVRNILCPLFADDYSYAFIWDGEHLGNLIDGIGRRERVKSLKDIFISLRSHYFTWGGRIFSHFLVHFFILIGKHLFNLVNSLVCVLLLYLILTLGGSGLNDIYLVLWVIGEFWFCVPFLIGTAIWLTGSCNYMWMSLAQCLFILPYAQGFGVNAFIFSFAGFLAGISNEAGGAGTIILALFFCVRSWLAGNFALWEISGLAAFCAGYAVIMLAPGNMRQLRLTQEIEPEYALPENMLWTRGMFVRNFYTGFLPVLAHEVVLYVPVILYFAQGHSFADPEGIYILAFCAASLAVPCLMMFSPEFPERAAFSPAIFLLIASVRALRNLSGAEMLKYLAPLLLADMALCLYADIDFYRQVRERFRLIREQKDKNLIIVPALRLSKTAFITGGRALNEYVIYWGDLEDDPNGNRSIMFAQYYGLSAIIAGNKEAI